MLTRAALVLASALLLFHAHAARAEDAPTRRRTVIVASAIGVRFFHPDLQLGDDFCFGGRAGIGLGKRWAVLLDFVASHPHREVTSVAAYVDAMRILGRANLLTGRFRPYVVAGIGGVLFMFNDTPSTAGGTLTGGLGADVRVAPQTSLFVEGSGDIYSQQDITYDIDGSVTFAGHPRSRNLGTVSTGIEVEF